MGLRFLIGKKLLGRRFKSSWSLDFLMGQRSNCTCRFLILWFLQFGNYLDFLVGSQNGLWLLDPNYLYPCNLLWASWDVVMILIGLRLKFEVQTLKYTHKPQHQRLSGTNGTVGCPRGGSNLHRRHLREGKNQPISISSNIQCQFRPQLVAQGLWKSVRKSWTNFAWAGKRNAHGKHERVTRQWSISSQHTSTITYNAAPRVSYFSAFHFFCNTDQW